MSTDDLRAKWRNRNRKIYKRNRILLDGLKNVPCADCGHRFPPYVMDFDHVRGEKKFTLAHKIMSKGVETLLEEADKCDVVCSNCHRVRTHNRKK